VASRGAKPRREQASTWRRIREINRAPDRSRLLARLHPHPLRENERGVLRGTAGNRARTKPLARGKALRHSELGQMSMTRSRILVGRPVVVALSLGLAMVSVSTASAAAPGDLTATPSEPPPPARPTPTPAEPPAAAAPAPAPAPAPTTPPPAAEAPATAPTTTETPTPPPAAPGDPAAPGAVPLTSTPPSTSTPPAPQQPMRDPFRMDTVPDTQGDPFRPGDTWTPYTGEPRPTRTTTVVVTDRYTPLPPPPPPTPPDRPKRFFVSGYGGLSFQLTTTSRRLSIMNGFQGGLLLGERLSIGLAFRRLSHRFGPDIRGTSGDRYQLGMVFGGGEIGVVVVRHGRFEMGIESLFGAGAACVDKLVKRNGHTDSKCVDAVRMFVIEPGAFIHVNLTNWARVGFDGGYRFVVREGFKPPNDFRLSGPYFGANLEFGWFRRG